MKESFKESVKEKYPFINKFSEEKLSEIYNSILDYSSANEAVENCFGYERSVCNNRQNGSLLQYENVYIFKDDILPMVKRLIFSRSDAGMQLAVGDVSYNEVQDNPKSFMNTFSFWTDLKASLPSAEEWEYVCAAGTDTRYSWGDKLQDGYEYTWGTQDPRSVDDFFGPSFDSRNGDKRVWISDYDFSQPVGLLKCNPWGLYDMVGLMSEFCTGENLTVAILTPAGREYRKTKKDEVCTKRGSSRGHNQLSYKEGMPGTFRVKLSISDKELEAAKKKVEKK